MLITSEQIRAARALLRLEQEDVARRAQVSIVTIRRIEAARGTAGVTPATVAVVRQALEQAGAEFIEGGVRQRREDAATRLEALRRISLRSGERLQGQVPLTDADLYDEDGLPA
jgi:transcriptional regulator with XRE-family HTH domain